MQIVSLEDNMHEMSKPIFFLGKIFRNIVCLNFTQHTKHLE